MLPKRILVALTLAGFFLPALLAGFKLPALIGDHMVLQQGRITRQFLLLGQPGPLNPIVFTI